MRKVLWIMAGITGLLFASVGCAQVLRVAQHAYDEPVFAVRHSTAPFEVRTYEPRIVAVTTVGAATRRSATSEGFSRLAGYIFGKNRLADGGSSKIAMTSPVESRAAGVDEFTITFTMPQEHDMADLPVPVDNRVKIVQLPAQTVATARFSGDARETDVSKLERDMLEYIAAQGYRPTSPITIAQYDPPWTPSMLRRNELVVDVALTAKSGP